MKWRIKSDLKEGTYYGKSVINSRMTVYFGETFECSPEEFNDYGYHYKGWNWTRDMVEEVKETEEKKVMKLEDFKVGKEYKKIGGSDYVGKVGICTEIDGEFVSFEVDGEYTGSYSNYGHNWWEPVETELKFGDMVTMIGGGSGQFSYLGRTPDGHPITMSTQDVSADTNFIDAYIWTSMDCKKVVIPPKKDTSVELTLSEIADKLDINVKDLKIVD